MLNSYYIICSSLCMPDEGQRLFLLSKKTLKVAPHCPPARQPSPAKAASSVYTGAGPIRACYNAGCANHRRHASQGRALQTHLRE
jgi:hypothetical protein